MCTLNICGRQCTCYFFDCRKQSFFFYLSVEWSSMSSLLTLMLLEHVVATSARSKNHVEVGRCMMVTGESLVITGEFVARLTLISSWLEVIRIGIDGRLCDLSADAYVLFPKLHTLFWHFCIVKFVVSGNCILQCIRVTVTCILLHVGTSINNVNGNNVTHMCNVYI